MAAADAVPGLTVNIGSSPPSLEGIVRAKKKSLEWVVSDYNARAAKVDRTDGAGKKRHRRLLESAQDYQLQVDVLDQVLAAYERATSG